MKNCKKLFIRIILSQHTNYWHKWLVHLHFHMFIADMLIFFCKVLKYVQAQTNILSHLMGWPAGIAIKWKWTSPFHQTGLGWWKQVALVLFDQKFSCEWNLSFFWVVLLNWLSHLPVQSALYNQILTQSLLLVSECCLA